MGLPNIGPIELIMLLGIIAAVVMILVRRSRSQTSDGVTDGPAPDFENALVVVRVTRSTERDAAIRWYQRDLVTMVDHGYVPTTQIWQPGEWSVIDFVIALVLIPFVIGVVYALYLVVMRPGGTMTVTYLRRDVAPAIAPSVI